MTELPYLDTLIVPSQHSQAVRQEMQMLSGYERDMRHLFPSYWDAVIDGHSQFSYVLYATNMQMSSLGMTDAEITEVLPHMHPVGYVATMFIRGGTDRPANFLNRTSALHVISFAVHPDFRRLGIATQLFGHLFTAIECNLAVPVSADNLDALLFMKGLKFPVVSEAVSEEGQLYYRFERPAVNFVTGTNKK